MDVVPTEGGSLFNEYCRLLSSAGVAMSTIPRLDAAAALQPNDVLLVVDMQLDFLPGGSFAVPEGDVIVPVVADAMRRFASAGASIFCTRDYHPINHCSFEAYGGSFPPHCVQGTRGSLLCPEVAETVMQLVQREKERDKQSQPGTGDGACVQVVFKGFSPDIDSFGALPYTEEGAAGRCLTSTPPPKPEPKHANSKGRCKGVEWTGASLLFSSNFEQDPNAPPDVMAILKPLALATASMTSSCARDARTEEVATTARRPKLVVCGVALDFCVLDSAMNATLVPDFKNRFDICIAVNASRPSHAAGVGAFGSGFLSDPAWVARKLRDFSIGFVLI